MPVIGRRTPGKGAPPSLEIALEAVQRRDLLHSLGDTLIQDAKEERPRHRTGSLPSRRHKLTDLVQPESERLRLPDELKAV